METVEVVIRINKNTFDAVNELSKFVDGNYIINGYQMKGNSTVGSMITAIAKGTVLPKGHEYIDRNNAITSICQYYATCERMKMFYFTPNLIKQEVVNILIEEPTIIEADKEVDNER